MADVVRKPSDTLLWAQLAFIGPFFFSFFFLLFTYYFPNLTKELSLRRALLYILPVILMLPFVPTRLNVLSIELKPWGTDFQPGPMYLVLLSYMVACFGWASRRLMVTYRKSQDALIKRQIVLIYIGVALMVSSGLVTNLILPVFFNFSQASVIGPAASALFVILASYAVVKHGVDHTKVIAAEFFTVVFVLLNFSRLFIASSDSDFIFQSVLFVISVIFGVLLIKSVVAEVHRHELLSVMTVELEKSNKHLSELSEAKSEFISIASHQLRTPVSVIKGYLSLMKDGAYGAVGGAVQDKIDQLYEMNERLIHLINNLLNVTRIERDNLAYFCQDVDAVEIIDHAVKELSLEAKNKGLDLRFRQSADGKVKVFADPDKLHEIIVNLIDNSLKYTQKGHVEVSLEPDRGEGFAVLRIEDTGIGMNPQDLEHLFEKFFRPAQTNSIRQSGMSMGLGLFICAKFLHGMGGDIWVDRTAPGEGTIFAVRLPTVASGVCNGADNDLSGT
jgi:signal transduction histidine kinase